MGREIMKIANFSFVVWCSIQLSYRCVRQSAAGAAEVGGLGPNSAPALVMAGASESKGCPRRCPAPGRQRVQSADRQSGTPQSGAHEPARRPAASTWRRAIQTTKNTLLRPKLVSGVTTIRPNGPPCWACCLSARSVARLPEFSAPQPPGGLEYGPGQLHQRRGTSTSPLREPWPASRRPSFMFAGAAAASVIQIEKFRSEQAAK